VKVTDQFLITDMGSLSKLGLWDISRELKTYHNLSYMDIANGLYNACSHLFIATIIEHDTTLYPNDPEWPNWKHNSDSSGWHEIIGHCYWNFFKSTKRVGTLAFHDSPDFSGTLVQDDGIHKFYGDIGQVGAFTWLFDVYPSLNPGDLWVSLPDAQHQIILEAQYGIIEHRQAWQDRVSKAFAFS